MDTLGYLLFGYMGVQILLAMWSFYLDQRLLSYVDKQYPEQGIIIRSHEGKWYPWSVGRRTLRALIKKESISDTELAQRAEKAKWSKIYTLGLFSIALIIFFIDLLLDLVK